MTKPPNYKEIYLQFFSPLKSKDGGEILSFPGFGFWEREYAEFLANFTREIPSLLADHGYFCEKVIHSLFNEIQLPQLQQNGTKMCPPFWDTISCFPATDAGQLSVIPCPYYIGDTKYDTSGKHSQGSIIHTATCMF